MSNPENSGALWRHADFLKLWAAQSVSSFGARITREGLPLAAVLTIHTPPAELGLLAALAQGPGLVVGLLAGGFVDRSRRRGILIAADILRAAILLTVPAAAWLHVLTMIQLYGVAALAGAASVLFDIADHAYLPSLIARADLMEGNTKLGITESIAEIGGPALAGVLVQALTAPIAIAVNALTYLASAAFLSAIGKSEAAGPAKERAPLHRSLSVGLSTIFGQPLVRPLFLITVAQPLFGGFFSALYVFYAIDVLHLTPAEMGVTIGVGGIGSLTGALLAAPIARRLGIGRAILFTGLASGLASFFIAFAHGAPAVAMAFLMLAQFFGDSLAVASIVSATSLRQSVVPLAVMGRVAAVFRAGAGAPAILGALLGGVLAAHFGARAVLFAGSCGVSAGMLWGFFSPLWRLQDIPVAPDTRAG
ncbi:MAG TPA: MFS transporter [Rhizomicrobium sp.]|nr:MFS transporter [Rhizomicrobium sp.]